MLLHFVKFHLHSLHRHANVAFKHRRCIMLCCWTLCQKCLFFSYSVKNTNQNHYGSKARLLKNILPNVPQKRELALFGCRTTGMLHTTSGAIRLAFWGEGWRGRKRISKKYNPLKEQKNCIRSWWWKLNFSFHHSYIKVVHRHDREFFLLRSGGAPMTFS